MTPVMLAFYTLLRGFKMNSKTTNQTCQLISAKELARILSFSKRQIHRLNLCHKLPSPIKIGGSLRFDLENDIKPWLAAGAPDRKTWEEIKQAEACNEY